MDSSSESDGDEGIKPRHEVMMKFTRKVLRSWAELSDERKAFWNAQAAEINKANNVHSPEDCFQYVLSQLVLTPTHHPFSNQTLAFSYLTGMLQSLMGFGPNQIGDCAFMLVGSFRRRDGTIKTDAFIQFSDLPQTKLTHESVSESVAKACQSS